MLDIERLTFLVKLVEADRTAKRKLARLQQHAMSLGICPACGNRHDNTIADGGCALTYRFTCTKCSYTNEGTI